MLEINYVIGSFVSAGKYEHLEKYKSVFSQTREILFC
jgi:hypothetical protein